MSDSLRRRGRQASPAALVLAALLLAGFTLRAGQADDAMAPAPTRAAATAVSSPITLRPPLREPATQRTRESSPARLVVPRIGVDTVLLPLGLTADGAMEVPDDAALAGWYAPGPPPGLPGPAVIAGHVDSRDGPGVFMRLAQLETGDRLTVVHDDGSQFVFRVSAVEQHPKSALPVERIWAAEEEPVLRLVTCGGFFNRRTGHYSDNVVVFADLLLQSIGQAI